MRPLRHIPPCLPALWGAISRCAAVRRRITGALSTPRAISIPNRPPVGAWLPPMIGVLIGAVLVISIVGVPGVEPGSASAPASDRRPAQASAVAGKAPVAAAPVQNAPLSATRQDLTKVRRALSALRKARAEIAALPGASVADLDRAIGELARTAQAGQVTDAVARTAPTNVSAASRGERESRAIATAVAYARAQLGKPYIYGGEGPRGYDCSGLTMKAYEAAGVSIPRTSDVQYWHTHHVNLGHEQTGDLVFFEYHRGMSGPGHVGIVIDPKRHLMIAAPHTGTDVKIQNYLTVGNADGLVGFGRPVNGHAIHPAHPFHGRIPAIKTADASPSAHRATAHTARTASAAPAGYTVSPARRSAGSATRRSTRPAVDRPARVSPSRHGRAHRLTRVPARHGNRIDRSARTPAHPSSPQRSTWSAPTPPSSRRATPRTAVPHRSGTAARHIASGHGDGAR
ncbi:C40 family peptidase [Actinoallomurus sp. CA-150999]|uniref:C40 family peptidase n=1 Tax=Actinoallomurus sp. CA-150999 TaxID=3239887 RepID=UPI003D8F5259